VYYRHNRADIRTKTALQAIKDQLLCGKESLLKVILDLDILYIINYKRNFNTNGPKKCKSTRRACIVLIDQKVAEHRRK
jgi:hypothetical protein